MEVWGKMPYAHTCTLVFLGLMAMGCYAVAHAAEASEKLRVGISPFAPFVMFTDKGPEGAAIDAWHLIVQKLGVESEFVECKNIVDKLEKLQAGAIDVAIGGISITEEREKHFDFTNSQFHTGLDILVRQGRDRRFPESALLPVLQGENTASARHVDPHFPRRACGLAGRKKH